jgi:hypothetical protein
MTLGVRQYKGTLSVLLVVRMCDLRALRLLPEHCQTFDSVCHMFGTVDVATRVLVL